MKYGGSFLENLNLKFKSFIDSRNFSFTIYKLGYTHHHGQRGKTEENFTKKVMKIASFPLIFGLSLSHEFWSPKNISTLLLQFAAQQKVRSAILSHFLSFFFVYFDPIYTWFLSSFCCCDFRPRRLIKNFILKCSMRVWYIPISSFITELLSFYISSLNFVSSYGGIEGGGTKTVQNCSIFFFLIGCVWEYTCDYPVLVVLFFLYMDGIVLSM